MMCFCGERERKEGEKYRSNIIKQIRNISDNPIHILIILHKPMTFRICHLAYNIESVEL